MEGSRQKLKLSFNAPAVLGFAAICVIAQVLNLLTGGASNRTVFSVYRASLSQPLTWVRWVCHVFGHADWTHLMNNMMVLLLLGPMLEEKYGTSNLIFVMLATALATGAVIMLFFPKVALLGASGIVFAFILLSSITSTQTGTIPVTFLLVAVLYLGEQLYQSLFVADNVSQLGHIIGGVVGSALGFTMDRLGMNRYKGKDHA
ncbi:MAG: rhomboid family intramembrane serine protease [Clostridia bacterium]|nr:rhomboid family intramembrane serine protease [Clostridia bacterium]